MLWLPGGNAAAIFGGNAADIFKAAGVATSIDSGYLTTPVDDVSVVTLK
jgi:hypothetical protein